MNMCVTAEMPPGAEIDTLLSQVVLRGLGDKLYDKRKAAALEVEQLVKTLAKEVNNPPLDAYSPRLYMLRLSRKIGQYFLVLSKRSFQPDRVVMEPGELGISGANSGPPHRRLCILPASKLQEGWSAGTGSCCCCSGRKKAGVALYQSPPTVTATHGSTVAAGNIH